MAIAKRVKEFTYILQEERGLPPAEQTRWRLKTLGYTEAEELEGREYSVDAAEGTKIIVNGLRKARLALNAGLLGWENFKDEAGADIPFRDGKSDMRRIVPDELLDLIRPTWAVELADAIRNEASLDLEAAKKLLIAVACSYRRSYGDGRRLVRLPPGESSEESQLWVRCARCWGESRSCPTCKGEGYEEVPGDPWAQVTEDSWEMLALFQDYPQAMPLAGGLYDQPARYLKAMRLLRSAIAEFEAQIAQQEEAERESRNG